MFSKLWASFYKEFLLVVRDVGGFAMLFIMPTFLIVIMAIIMDVPFKDYQDVEIDLLVVNEDADTLGNIIERGLKKSEIFSVITSIEGEPITKDIAENLVKKGDYTLGVIIPSKSTQIVNQKVDNLVGGMLEKFGMIVEKQPLCDSSKASIQVFIDPSVKKSFSNSVTNSIQSFVSQVESKLIIDGFYSQISDDEKDKTIPQSNFIELSIIYPSGKSNYEQFFTNSVQHNVPAWSVFAMFLIVIPLASNMIKERDGGAMTRLKIAPGSYLPLLTGKLVFYLIVCLVQFLLMLLVGIFLLPFFELPALEVGNSLLSVFVVAFVVAFAATSFGVFIGSVFNSYQQASIFGAVADVIMAAVGGIMVPIIVMPEFMQTIGKLIPLNWGLESFNDLFLRGATLIDILPKILMLFGFSLTTLFVSWWINNKNMIN